MDRRQEKKKINWFLAVIAGLTLLKLLMIQGLVIYPVSSASCDDALLKNWGLEMAGGNWTGPFSCYIFTKEVGFSFYLAVINRLHLPYLFATNIIYIFGTLAVLYAVSHIVKKKWVLCVIYAATLFHPVMTAVQTGQRVYRNGFAVALTLLVFGSLLNLYFEITETSFLKSLAWAVLAALSLGYLWETKSDTIWLMPFTIAVLLATAVLVIKKRKEFKVFPRLLLLLFPVLGIQFFSTIVDNMNTKYYGDIGIAYYGPAMSILTNIDTEDAVKNVSLSQKTFQELCELSPTLASTKEKVIWEMKKYDRYDTHPGDGNVEDGWLGWALIRAFYKAGYYVDCPTANTFYQKVYEELSAAVEQGHIQLKQTSALDSYHMATAKDRKEMIATIGEIWNYVAGHGELFSDVCAIEEKDLLGSQGFELFTRERAYYTKMDADYCCIGWILYPQHDLKDLKVFIEDAEGNQYQQITFHKSWDVRRRYPQTPGAENSRFTVKWNYDGRQKETEFYLAAYHGAERVAKNKISKKGLEDMQQGVSVGSVDGYFSNTVLDENHKAAQGAVKRCNVVYQIYHATGKLLAWLGVAAYLIFTAMAVRAWLGRRFDTVNAWLVITGIGLSLLVLFAGVAVTHLKNCPAIGYMYLSAAYPLFNLAAILSILSCIECLFCQVPFLRRIQRQKGGGDGL